MKPNSDLKSEESFQVRLLKLWQSERSVYFLGLLIWLCFAVFQTGYDSPDEHFPTLEASSRFLFGRFNETWEWTAGLRSWIQPFLLACWLKPFTFLGISDPITLDAIARVLPAFFSVVLIWSMGVLARLTWNANEGMVKNVRFATALSWPLVVWGTRHGSDSFVIPFLFSGLALSLSATSMWSVWRSFVGGALLGLSIHLRYPCAPLILLCLFFGRGFIKRKRRVFLGFFCAFLVGVAFDAFQYLQWQGAVKFPIWEFFRFNILEGSGEFHRSPWWEPIAYLLLLWCPPAIGLFGFSKKMRAITERKLVLRSWCFRALIGYVFLLANIKHHEFRFLFPLVPMTILLSAVSPGKRMNWLISSLIPLILCFVFYSQPRAPFVRALSEGTQHRRGQDGNLLVHEISSHLPLFYSRLAGSYRPIESNEFERICDKINEEIFEKGQYFYIFTSKNCDTPRCETTWSTHPGRVDLWISRLRNKPPKFYRTYRCRS